jgi:hypothetical protein
VNLELHPDVVADIRALPDDGARRAAIQVIADVRADLEAYHTAARRLGRAPE